MSRGKDREEQRRTEKKVGKAAGVSKEEWEVIMKEIRQKYHFTPQKGWMNDPNGLIYAEGKYHIFYQHYPEDTKWGPMHWGHAVSEDLLHWEHLPIALYPTEDEYAFSGSAILDHENLSGLGDGTKPPMLLFYTGHNPKTWEQQQCLAFSTDYIHFEKYGANPIVANPGEIAGEPNPNYRKDFRDPKVLANLVRGGFTMVLAMGEEIGFFHSTDLFHWEYTGSFVPGAFGYGGICECPDLFACRVDDEEKYVLSMSMVFANENGPGEIHLMQYFVGDFDGDTFRPCQPFAQENLLDFGKDNYAMVGFAECNELLMLGWGEDWDEARVNTHREYFGKLTLARKVQMIKVGDRYLLKQTPVWNSLDENCPGGNAWRSVEEDVFRDDFTLSEGGEYSFRFSSIM